jgi:hypothetical protein
MNVNLWGPDLWSLLHGIAGLASRNPLQQDIEEIVELMKDLCILLPCIHCRKSYCSFHESLNVRTMFERGDGIKCIWNAHSLVDDKLEAQKIESLFAATNIPKSIQKKIIEKSYLLSNRPSLTVVQKRWELSEGCPFREQSVWRVIFSFILCVDNETSQEAEIRLVTLRRWIKNLSSFLSRSLQYKLLASRLSLINIKDNATSREAFDNVALSREGILTHLGSEIWLKSLWKVYVGNLPAGTCGTFTCA